MDARCSRDLYRGRCARAQDTKSTATAGRDRHAGVCRDACGVDVDDGQEQVGKCVRDVRLHERDLRGRGRGRGAIGLVVAEGQVGGRDVVLAGEQVPEVGRIDQAEAVVGDVVRGGQGGGIGSVLRPACLRRTKATR